MSSADATTERLTLRSASIPKASSWDPARLTRTGLAAALLYLLLIPEQFNFSIQGIYLSPFRIFLICTFPYILANALKPGFRFVWPDLLIALGLFWIFLATYLNSGGQIVPSLIVGTSHVVDMGLAYFFARVTIRTPKDLRYFLVFIAPGVLVTGVLVMIEAFTHRRTIQALSQAITGNPMYARTDARLGFMRGTASFPHPILAGIFLASLFPLYLMAGLRGWPKIVGVIGSGLGAFTMSSAAMLGLVVGGFLRVYDWLTERIANLTWRLFFLFAAMSYFVIENTSNTGFYGLLVRYASLNSASAYNRILIWRYGTENVKNNPWFGIGYEDWDRPAWMHSGSFDFFWLILSLRFGIPNMVFMLGATLVALFMLMRRTRSLPPTDARLIRGLAISLGVFALGLNSVSLWLSTLAWFFMLIGMSVSLGASTPGRTRILSRIPSRLDMATPAQSAGAST
ncbi:MAG: hypothetical protein V2I43_00755 [Parvularcula sp.]|jgi:hypothetical protein|nr:hypothetical protein [Parvularcula sp.]